MFGYFTKISFPLTQNSKRLLSTLCLRLEPAHRLQIQQIHVVEERIHIPTAKDQHLRFVDERGRVSETGRWRPAALWSLEPSHRQRVKGVDVLVNLFVLALSAEDYDS